MKKNNEKPDGDSLPLFLNKINSDKKAIECANILEACHPTHAERLFLVGFLKFAGYSMGEVIKLIQDHCQWSDYEPHTTAYQIGTVFHQRPQRTQNIIPKKSRVRKWELSPLEVLKIRYQKSVALSHLLCEEENANSICFPHPERLSCPDFNPSAEFLRK